MAAHKGNHKAPPVDDHFKLYCFFENEKIRHRNSHEKAYLFSKIRKDVANFVVRCSCDWRILFQSVPRSKDSL